jgi:two-component system NtrC family sensor kinase
MAPWGIRYSEFLDSVPAAIYRTTLEGQLVFCNRALAQLFGFASPQELMAYPVVELYHNRLDRGFLVDSIVQNGYLQDFPVALKRKDGSAMWVAVTAKTVLDDDRMVIHIDGVMRHVTVNMEAETAAPDRATEPHGAQILNMQEEQRKDEKLEGVLEMAGGVAHRLNQPLTIVNNLLVEVLSDLAPDGRIYPKLVGIQHQIKKMNEIAKKISSIKTYEAMDYVAGIKIVDIDKAS